MGKIDAVIGSISPYKYSMCSIWLESLIWIPEGHKGIGYFTNYKRR